MNQCQACHTVVRDRDEWEVLGYLCTGCYIDFHGELPRTLDDRLREGFEMMKDDPR
jgi:hypothetical protein